jgi:hypothetical protein
MIAVEKHYSPIQLSQLWQLSPTKIRNIFEAGPVSFALVSRRAEREGS